MEIDEQHTAPLDQRLQLAKSWIEKSGIELCSEFESVAGDASFRRYFRFETNDRSLILMDAPPPGEDVGPFIDVARRLRKAMLHAPRIILSDEANGFLLLEDLGDDMYRDLLDTSNVDTHFPDLFELFAVMAQNTDTTVLPTYDTGTLRAEMDLLPRWYLERHRNDMPRDQFDLIWDEFCDRIIASALDQPQSFVHRDFHSSNLLRTSANTVGIIDFQDAVRGPVSYDFISLIWDRHITWPRAQIESWMEEMHRRLGLGMPAEKWQRHCDLMGLQRNVKVVGIFARLYYRDQKQGYVEMIPRFYDYLLSTLRLYPEFSDMLTVLENKKCVP
jgi:aminoglycoside/choline kinase family phosphotransferase